MEAGGLTVTDVTEWVAAYRTIHPGHPITVYANGARWHQLLGSFNGHALGLNLWEAGDGHNLDAMYVPGTGSSPRYGRTRT